MLTVIVIILGNLGLFTLVQHDHFGMGPIFNQRFTKEMGQRFEMMKDVFTFQR
ncbi:hypothetical protein FC83_GL003335 [Agrilactobacillus composti DSM 18527 = JCM 14202]|uniref:Uncharacterized protein n=1 Tax=Agrilactobacillus composti DSM 18527 = JCM 14202 TaxID=1423734 RepID=A0A0R1Y1R6_9LACO|nr:hypothetical protein FC83_GL003335 [Agrilactobacillus composti DSM 18527 = JCM 14202]